MSVSQETNDDSSSCFPKQLAISVICFLIHLGLRTEMGPLDIPKHQNNVFEKDEIFDCVCVFSQI